MTRPFLLSGLRRTHPAALFPADRPPSIPRMGHSSKTHPESEAWQQFWTGRARGGEHQFRDPEMARLLHRHWTKVFTESFNGRQDVDLVDLACGEGEVLALAAETAVALPATRLQAVGTDVAWDAVALAAQPVGDVRPVPAVADCARLPFSDESFDLAVSQYGLEYAGAEAFLEAGRIVKPGGRFHALVHVRGGAVEVSCQEIADLLGAVIEIALLDRMSDFIVTIPRAVSGEVSGEEAQSCADALRLALESVARVTGAAAPGPARDHVARLVQDCQSAAGRLGAYRTEDLQVWIEGQKAELAAFEHRMTSMVRVAQSEERLRDVVENLQVGGLEVSALETLAIEAGAPPLAWILDARRSG